MTTKTIDGITWVWRDGAWIFPVGEAHYSLTPTLKMTYITAQGEVHPIPERYNFTKLAEASAFVAADIAWFGRV